MVIPYCWDEGLSLMRTRNPFHGYFQTSKTCMWGCAPKAIITDQCMAMKNAIEIIFPDSWHRWCICHIMKKLPEKLKGYNDYERISWCIRKAVYDSLTIEDFEIACSAFVLKYAMQCNKWLQDLYLKRGRWVPAYVKGIFWTGMPSTKK